MNTMRHNNCATDEQTWGNPDGNMQLKIENIPKGEVKDGYHLGNLIMDFFNNGTEDHLWQIDAGTGESEMKSSVRFRSIQLARCLRNAGLKSGDVVAVSGVNHLNVHIPFYAAYLNGHPLIGIDPFYKYEEIKILVQKTKPKIAFCEASSLCEYENVVKDLGLNTKLVTFGDGEKSFAEFIKMHDNNAPEHEFRVAKFDTNKVYAWFISTSGTSGLPKVAAFKHSCILKMVNMYSTLTQKELVRVLNQSSVQWITGYMSSLYMIYANQIKVQTSSPFTVEHAIDIINKYKPAICTSSPLLFNKILKHEKYCDLTCFKQLVITAFAMNPAIVQKLKARMHPDSVVMNMLGQTECLGALLMPAPDGPLGNVGTELPVVRVQLVDPSTSEVITKPNMVGELWSKGPTLKEYYQNPEATAAAFSPDGWFKTGDLLYKDENGYYFYVERMSSSFRVGNYFVIPKEIEFLLKEHPEVEEACVVDIPHPEYNKQTVACVQLRPESTLTEQQIKDIVAEKLSIHKHLHGGVVFVDHFPRTFSDKIARGKVKDYVLEHLKTRVSVVSELPCSGNTRKLITTFQRLTSTEFVTTYQRLGSTEHVRYISTGTH